MWSAGARRDNGSFEVCKQFKCGEALQEALHDTRKQQQITVQNDFLFNFHLLCRAELRCREMETLVKQEHNTSQLDLTRVEMGNLDLGLVLLNA